MEENDMTWLWVIGAAVAAYFIYQAITSASASSTSTTAATVPYYTIGPNGDLQYNTGGTPGQYPECDPLHGYPQVPCQVGPNAGTGAQGAQGPGSPASF